MAKRMPGLKKEGSVWHMQKKVNGRWIRGSTGTCDLREAEQVLAKRIFEVREEQVFGINPVVTFSQAAARFLEEECPVKSLEQAKYALIDAEPFIWHTPIDEIHDGSLNGLRQSWAERGLKAGTQNRRLGIITRILSLCARKWRHDNNKPWLGALPLIEKTKGVKRKPYPLSWDEQERLFPLLPEHLQPMALFAVNTGLRQAALCDLQWKWEVKVPELKTSVFLCPGWMNGKNDDEEYLLVLNRAALSVIESRRDNHRTHVFTYHGKKIAKMNSHGWRNAWKKAGLPVEDGIRRGVHNLRHTFGHRLRAAGVAPEDRKDLMWHTNGDMSRHYATPDIERLLMAAESILDERRTILRVVN